ncbi:MAG: hypothetical protein JXO51_03775 [Candidatus Aminicenantes bacterium]|nr:hypothetical protein [Candidatus Aminicenantes bacterium]
MLLGGAGCSKGVDYDIRGDWSFRSATTEIFSFSFSGSAASGRVTETRSPEDGEGNYAVSGEEVVFDFNSTRIGGRSCQFRGQFVSADLVSGLMDISAPYSPFSWRQDVTGERR